MAVSFYLATLGCKVNQYESHALREAWSARGWLEAESPEQAGVILVNSCAVTARAVADVRNAVRRLHRAAPESAIIVTGCAAEVLEKELAGLPGVRAVIGQSRKEELLADFRGRLLASEGFRPAEARSSARPAGAASEKTKGSGTASFPAFAVSGYDRSRAVLKVQDGCSHGCTYCIVPLTRGRSVSRPPEDILAEMSRLHAAGFQELILSGINLRQYGRDFPRAASIRDFWTLLAWLEERLAPDWAGRARWRLSSLEPGQLGEAALSALSDSRMVAPHLHISLQSGSPAVLRRMGRGHYDPASLPEFLKTLRRAWPVMGLGADILMGFPEESEAEFEETRVFAQDLPLTYAHVFPFSPRPGTSAAAMPGHLPRELAEERAAVIRDIASVKKEAFLRFLLDRPGNEPGGEAGNGLRMVLESRDTGLGVSEYYASCRLPEADFPAEAKAGQLLAVRPVALERGVLRVALKKN